MMSKEKKIATVPVGDVATVVSSEPIPVATPATPLTPPPPPTFTTPPAPIEKLTEVDRLTLDLARTKRQTVLAEAKTALANNEKSELEYKYLILQVYMKYGLTADDALSEAGDIIRGGAVQKPQGR